MLTGNYTKIEVSLDDNTIRDMDVLAQRQNASLFNAWDRVLRKGIEAIYNKAPHLHKKEIDNEQLKKEKELWKEDCRLQHNNVAFWRSKVEKLEAILDDIDTASDMFKPEDSNYTKYIYKKIEEFKNKQEVEE